MKKEQFIEKWKISNNALILNELEHDIQALEREILREFAEKTIESTLSSLSEKHFNHPVFNLLMELKNGYLWPQFEFYAKLTKEVEACVWNGKHPVEENKTKHILPEGTKVRVWMVSRFGDVGITAKLENATGYDARNIDPDKDLTEWEVVKNAKAITEIAETLEAITEVNSDAQYNMDNWIPIEIGLPKRNQNVLLKRKKPFHLYHLTGFQRDGIFYSNETANVLQGVIAWMPIPS